MDEWKVAVLGDGGVGKTALAIQVTLNKFVAQSLTPLQRYRSIGDHHNLSRSLNLVQTYDPTIEDCYRKPFVVDNRICLVEVLDTAGQEDYAMLRDQWVREGQGFILVYSITSRSTFDRVKVFYELVRHIKGGDPILVLVGNKADKAYDREVSKEEGAALARQFACGFIETSAKTAQNLDLVFASLIRALRETRHLETGAAQNPGREKEKRKCIIL
ncbi:ras protein [Mycena olivaceomarginata]|nr:ras protein [Mycena olivaceomarginata]